MDIEVFRQACLVKPGPTESMPLREGAPVFKVLHKMFATLSLDGDQPAASLTRSDQCN